MAIVQDAATSITAGGSGGSYTFSHTCTGSNLYLFVVVEVGSSGSCTGVTYNSVSMTQLVTRTFNTTRKQYIFGLVNPSTGSNTVSISYTVASTCYGAAVSFTGVVQSNPTITGGASGNTLSLTSTVDNSAMITMTGDNVTAAGTGSTSLSINNGVSMMKSNPLLITPAGSKSMTMTGGDSCVGVIFAPVVTTNIKTINGLAVASVKNVNGLAIASVKNVNGLA